MLKDLYNKKLLKAYSIVTAWLLFFLLLSWLINNNAFLIVLAVVPIVFLTFTVIFLTFISGMMAFLDWWLG